MSTHARLSPSGSAGWMNCAQWTNDGAGSRFALYGTLGHEVAAAVLSTEADQNSFLGLTLDGDEWADPVGDQVRVDVDLLDLVDAYVDYIRGFEHTHDRLVEVAVPIGFMTGEAGAKGTADCLLLARDGSELAVVDFKTGRGEVVEAERNSQLMMYAWGALEHLHAIGRPCVPESVRLVIVQPRVGPPSEWTCTVADLLAFAEEVRDAAKRHGNGEATPGEKQCRWCSRKATCAELARSVQVAIGAQFEDLTTEDKSRRDELVEHLAQQADIATALSAVDLIENWCAAIRTEAERRLHNGIGVQGWKLVAGKRGARSWSSTSDAEAVLRGFRLRREQIFEQKLISPATAEKLLRDKPKRWTRVAALITQTDGKPTVAPIHDKRPAIAVRPVAELFDDHTGADLA